MVDINWTLVAQIFNFLILFAIVALFAYKPIVKIMDERQRRIAESMENAETVRLGAQKAKAEYEHQLDEARAQAQEIIDKAKKTANDACEQMLAEARAEQEQIVKSAKEQIEREKVNALLAVRGEVVALSMQLASKVVEKKLDEETDRKLINEFLDEITSKSGGLPC
ncbi:MAG: F0F1 ATP synthase subunit B [Acidaminococcales bacterium]|nr:F0F1 ATP synthase subunit B [Acidaminococcales bacterium]